MNDRTEIEIAAETETAVGTNWASAQKLLSHAAQASRDYLHVHTALEVMIESGEPETEIAAQRKLLALARLAMTCARDLALEAEQAFSTDLDRDDA